jgi:SNF2 family DNA or RNA helicase
MISDDVLNPGQRINHPEFGEGVVVESIRDGFIRVFFSTGERRVPVESLTSQLSPSEQAISGVVGTGTRLRSVRLSYQSHVLPLLASSSALTSAKIDLLPHQVVLTHRVALEPKRRFLIGDEVGLGKTIETALILRELASRGELKRALMIVPAGLVNNWHRELNEVFNLGFEVFGSEGDVTDRKSNAFAKHDLLIASIDTLKRPARIQRLLEAPPWDLVVFDEAHHLAAYRSGNKVRKTENYKLAEALREHTRDLLLLSATPHQGDHFRFWMLIQLLDPTLFKNSVDMVENRHRLNSVVFRRTKADACRSDGSSLFARRWVHTESFTMSGEERLFYNLLRDYLEDGFALAKRQGRKGQAIGFLMAIFQKIAASSFVAVRRTLRKRLIMLIIHEAILKDRALDLDGRETLHKEARILIHEEYGLQDDQIGRGEVDRILADLKLKLIKSIGEDELALFANSYTSEEETVGAEDLVSLAVGVQLPEERRRITCLLREFPEGRETKVDKLLRGLGTLWQQNPHERVVVFATYLGTVELIGKEIEKEYPGQGVVVLRGGDHGAKVAAERRFRKKDGPKVLICTAAGREGINLQFAKIMFNFDLPWNPMDVEQRIGRIHRYGQTNTAQVYNLVLSDTIEGKIFLLLDEKLIEIAKAVGKVDEQGNVAEDLRSQILGQLSERLNYDRLYQEALGDPELKRTRLELEEAVKNASEARKVVFELFQELDRFNIDDYGPFTDIESDFIILLNFCKDSLSDRGKVIHQIGPSLYEITDRGSVRVGLVTTDRDKAQESDEALLLGLDHPILVNEFERWRHLPPGELGVSVKGDSDGVITVWRVEGHGAKGENKVMLVTLAVDSTGLRSPVLERNLEALLQSEPIAPRFGKEERLLLLHDQIEPMLQRELVHSGLMADKGGYSAVLTAWIESINA